LGAFRKTSAVGIAGSAIAMWAFLAMAGINYECLDALEETGISHGYVS
jgi:hypothetical protein